MCAVRSPSGGGRLRKAMLRALRTELATVDSVGAPMKRAFHWSTRGGYTTEERFCLTIYLIADDGHVRVFDPYGHECGTVAEIARCSGYALSFKRALGIDVTARLKQLVQTSPSLRLKKL